MKKQIFYILAVLTLALTLCIGALAVEVGTADELVAIMADSAKWGEDITLIDDIDLTGKEQAPIGNYTIPYTGTFNGAGYVISGLCISTDAINIENANVNDITAGLFGVVKGATIKNVLVIGSVTNNVIVGNAESKIDGYHSATGGIVGTALVGTTLENLTSYVEVNGPCQVGGVAGYLKNFDDDGAVAPITAYNCINYATVNPTHGNAGGVFGRVYAKSSEDIAINLDSCINYADVTSNSHDRNRLAGIVGYVRSEGGVIVINNCRNEGNITGDVPDATGSNRPYVGAIVGRIELTGATSALQITNCVNTGKIDSSFLGGGIVGLFTRGAVAINNPSVVENCINIASVRGDTYAAGIVGCSDCGAPALAEGEDATPYLVQIVNNLNFGDVAIGSNSGGVISQAKNVYVANNVTFDTVACKVAATSVGTTVVENNYYIKGMLVDFNPVGTNTELQVEDIAKAESYPTLDFDNVWVMAKDYPMLRTFADEEFDIEIEKPFDPSDVIVIPVPIETTSPIVEITEPEDISATEVEVETSFDETEDKYETEEETKPEGEEETKPEGEEETKTETEDVEEDEEDEEENKKEEKEFPWTVLIICITVVVVAIAAVVIVLVLARKKK